MQQDVTWFVSASATQAPTLHHVGFGFFFPPQIYLHWPLHGISHFRLVSHMPQAAGTSCCTSTQWDCKRSHTRTPGNCVQSSFNISIIEQQEGASVTATKRGTGWNSKIPGVKPGTQSAGTSLSGCCWSSKSVLASLLEFFPL